MATTIKLKNGSGAPLASDLVQGEPALDLTNKRLYSEDSGGTVVEIGTNPSTLSIAGTAVTATAAELNTLDGITATTAELNILDGVTATTAELNILDGVTATTAELNVLDGVTAFLDEDDMSSDSATSIPSQQSVKAYVDSQVASADTLSELTDTNITSPADGALLFYDTGTSKWIDNVVSGDITIADTGVAAIEAGVIVNADVNASAAIDVSKTALTAGTGLTLTTNTLSVDASQTQITAVGTITTGTWQGTAIADAYVANDLTISGGTVDNTVIGGTTAAAGTFTNLTASGTFTLGGTAVTATATELNILDGVTATTAELNILDGVTSTTAELNILDGVTATTTEINYLDVTTLGTSEASKAVTADSNAKVILVGTTSVAEMIEKVDIPTSTTGTISFDFLSQAVQFYNTNQTANRTINFRGDSSNTLNSIMAVGESMTAAVLMKQGSTAYYLNAYQIDGSAVTPEWSGGSAPSEGNVNSIDSYVFTIIKTANATFTVLASQSKYA